MATSSEPPSTIAASANAPAQQLAAPETEGAARSTTPVEMRALPSSSTDLPQPQSAVPPISSDPPQLSLPASEPSLLSQDIAQARSDAAAAESTAQPTPSDANPPAPIIPDSTEGIGPSTDKPVAVAGASPDISTEPSITITLLLTNGARHPYRLDGRYLQNRNVKVEAMDPFNISVYKLKELILRDWRKEWEAPPSSPSSIRLIHFGRMLDDKSLLKDCRFQQESPNVVHMTIKPQETVDEEETRTGKGGSRRDGDDETHAGCRCVIL